MNIWTVLLHSAQASLTACFLLILQRLFRDKLSPKWRYTIWFVLLVRLVLPPQWGPGMLDPSPWINGLKFSLALGVASHQLIADGLFVLYCLGVLVCALWLLLGWARLRRTVREGAPVEGGRWQQIAAWAGEFGLTPPVRAVESRQARGPFLMGALRPVLVVPMGWQADKNVVLHELLHLQNRDVAAGWLTALFRCLHWWNPFLWRVFDRIDNQREERCDQQVLERLVGEERRDYGRTLLSMAEDGAVRTPGATSMANGGAHIKTRIESIARFKTFPQGMGLVSVCMTLILLPNLVVGFPSFETASSSLPSAVRYLGPGWQLAWGMSARPATVPGALDTYAKGLQQNNLAWQAAALAQEEYDALWERRGQPAFAYDTGPMFRGVYEDGEGGYWTQMYHFRREEDGRVGYSRETLSLRPDRGGWSMTILSRGEGLLNDPIYPADQGGDWFQLRGWGKVDNYCIPIPEKPILTWRGEYNGVEFEFWPETNLMVEAPAGDSSLIQELNLEEFITVSHHANPDSEAQFSNCKGIISGRLTNTTNETRSFDLTAYQATENPWAYQDPDNPNSFIFQYRDPIVGNDLENIHVQLAPGETLPFRHGGQGRGTRNGLPFGQCISAGELRAAYDLEAFTLTREVNLQ